jgi:hypothetical protein
VRANEHERWHCQCCHGALLAVAEVVREMLAVAPNLMPDGGVRGLTTLGRRTSEPPLLCAVCGAEMEPVFLGGMPVDRCNLDELLWLDPGELEHVLARAEQQNDEVRPGEKSLFLRLHAWLFPD